MKSGTIFDNILVTDDVAEAEKEAKELFEKTKEGEKTMKDKVILRSHRLHICSKFSKLVGWCIGFYNACLFV